MLDAREVRRKLDANESILFKVRLSSLSSAGSFTVFFLVRKTEALEALKHSDSAMTAAEARLHITAMTYADKVEAAEKIWAGELSPVWGVNMDITTLIEVMNAARKESERNIQLFGVGTTKSTELESKFGRLFIKAFFHHDREKDYPLLNWDLLSEIARDPFGEKLSRPEDLVNKLGEKGAAEAQLIELFHELATVRAFLETYAYRYEDKYGFFDVSNFLRTALVDGFMRRLNIDRLASGIGEAAYLVYCAGYAVQQMAMVFNALVSGELEGVDGIVRRMRFQFPYYADLVYAEILRQVEAGNPQAAI